MKKILYTFVVFALPMAALLMGGCKKSATVNGLVASYTEVNSGNGATVTTVYTFSYDGQNRRTELQETNQTATTYAYSSGSVTVTQGSSVTVYTLNSAGLATSDNQGNTYVYDGNGYLTNKTNAGTSTSYTVSNGDIASYIQTTGGVSSTYSFTYLGTTDYRSAGLTFLGKNSVNVVNSETISTPASTTYVFSYTFDSKGRVQTETIVSGGITLSRSFTYVD